MSLFNLNSGNHNKPKYIIAQHSEYKKNATLLVYSRSREGIMDKIIRTTTIIINYVLN